jgi:hypothetical protein
MSRIKARGTKVPTKVATYAARSAIMPSPPPTAAATAATARAFRWAMASRAAYSSSLPSDTRES